MPMHPLPAMDFGEPHDLHGREIQLGGSRFSINRHPDGERRLRGQPMKSQGQQQTDHTLGHPQGNGGKSVIRINSPSAPR